MCPIVLVSCWSGGSTLVFVVRPVVTQSSPEAAPWSRRGRRQDRAPGTHRHSAHNMMDGPIAVLPAACDARSLSQSTSAADADADGGGVTEPLLPKNRLAAVNQFTLDPNEPERGLQELVQELMKELGSGQQPAANTNRHQRQERGKRRCSSVRRRHSSCSHVPCDFYSMFSLLSRQAEGSESSVPDHDGVRLLGARVEAI